MKTPKTTYGSKNVFLTSKTELSHACLQTEKNVFQSLRGEGFITLHNLCIELDETAEPIRASGNRTPRMYGEVQIRNEFFWNWERNSSGSKDHPPRNCTLASISASNGLPESNRPGGRKVSAPLRMCFPSKPCGGGTTNSFLVLTFWPVDTGEITFQETQWKDTTIANKWSHTLGLIHTGCATRCARQCKQMKPAVMNGGVHTEHKQHHRICVRICVLASSVDWLRLSDRVAIQKRDRSYEYLSGWFLITHAQTGQVMPAGGMRHACGRDCHEEWSLSPLAIRAIKGDLFCFRI